MKLYKISYKINFLDFIFFHRVYCSLPFCSKVDKLMMLVTRSRNHFLHIIYHSPQHPAGKGGGGGGSTRDFK